MDEALSKVILFYLNINRIKCAFDTEHSRNDIENN
jgi:hypothetical protein